MGKYQRIICKICLKDFGQEKSFIEHINDIHDLQNSQQLYCEWNNIIEKKCLCGCNENVKWNGWKHGYSKSNYILGHNARIYTAFTNFEIKEKIKIKKDEGYKTGRIKSWNKGLTKETNEVLKQSAIKKSKTLSEKYSSGVLTSWHGREGSDESYKKISIKKKKLYSEGKLISWNKGLTKNSNNKLKEIGEKIKKTYEKKGRDIGKRVSSEEFKERFEKNASDVFIPEFNWTNFYRVKLDKFPVRCKKCNEISYKTLYMIENTPICHSCHPKESKGQLEIYEFVKNICNDAILSDRSQLENLELDIYVPSKKLAIEYNGLYWHSEKINKNKNYHFEKTKNANDKDIKLFHIYEDEWKNKTDIIKSMIKNSLGICENKIGARECIIKQLSSKDKKEFFDKNHLDGDTKSKFAYGLFYDDKLVSAISLRKPFHNKWASYLEVARFCSLLNYNIVGGFGKLSSHILKIHSMPLMSYMDKRFGGNGKAYLKSGWNLDGETNERFWWTDFIKRYDRFWCRADKLRSMTENEVAEEKGVYRIWGVGNKRFVLQ